MDATLPQTLINNALNLYLIQALSSSGMLIVFLIGWHKLMDQLGLNKE